MQAGRGIPWVALWAIAAFVSPLAMAEPVGVQARGKIKHVVIIVQENRTFDNIFGGDPGSSGKPNFDRCPARPVPFPGADATFGTGIPTVQCTRYENTDPNGQAFSTQAGHDVWQCLKSWAFSSPGWTKVAQTPMQCADRKLFDQTTQPFLYLANDLRRSYWDIAQKYVLGDHFFAVTSTSSFPGHQYIVADQSKDDYGDVIADQPTSNKDGGGCKDNPYAQVTVPALGNDGFIQMQARDIRGECYQYATLADRMEAGRVSWAHYTTLDWKDDKFVPSDVFDGFINSEHWYKKVESWPTSLRDLRSDIQRGKLGNVTWVKPPCIPLSDHPGVSHDYSADWVGSVINWIGMNPDLWGETAIFVVWDDWGGFYDHVLPPPTRQSDGLGPGLRTPFLVISPYGVNGTVVHTPADYGSVLKFVEDLFELQPLTEVDAQASDLTGFFDFSKQRPFAQVWVKHKFTPGMCVCPASADEIDR